MRRFGVRLRIVILSLASPPMFAHRLGQGVVRAFHAASARLVYAVVRSTICARLQFRKVCTSYRLWHSKRPMLMTEPGRS
jgi:hypothetical protein